MEWLPPSKKFVIPNVRKKNFHLPDFSLELQKFLEVSCALIVSYIQNFNNNNNTLNCKWSVAGGRDYNACTWI